MSDQPIAAQDGREHSTNQVLEEEIDVLKDEIEILEDEIEILEEEIEAEGRHPHRPRAHVQIDNSDDGETVRMRIAYTSTIEQVIERMYREFHLSHETGDRLTRAGDGQDVFAHRRETVREYVRAQDDSPRIHWIFAGDTGGAES